MSGSISDATLSSNDFSLDLLNPYKVCLLQTSVANYVRFRKNSAAQFDEFLRAAARAKNGTLKSIDDFSFRVSLVSSYIK